MEKRRGPDWLVRLLGYLGVLGWLLLLSAMVILDRARPQSSLIDERLLARLGIDIDLRRAWDMGLVHYIFALMLCGLVLSAFGLFLNTFRQRRRDDHYRISLVLLALISLAGVVFYVFRFYA